MNISIIGTGAMGTGMSEAILNAGHNLTVFDRTKEKTKFLENKGANVALTPEEAIYQSDITIFVVIDGHVVLDILSQPNVLEVLKDKKIGNASTSNLKTTVKINDLVNSNEGNFIEISMQAVPESLKSATGELLVGCDDTDWDFWNETLSSFSGSVTRVGNVGDTAKLDLINLVGFNLSLLKTAYMVAVGQKYGINKEIYAPIIENAEPNAQYFLPNMLNENYNQISGTVEGNTLLLKSQIDSLEDINIATDVLDAMVFFNKKASELGYSEKDGTAILEGIKD